MTKHLSGSKRLAVIQRWINGHDDPEWEVLPTRKEGKYIVKKRETPIQKVEEVEETQEVPDEQEEELEKPQKPIKAKKVAPKPVKSQKATFDPTVNLEILNQLKLLGEEIKTKREKKEQKRMIKEVVNKQIRKPKPYYIEEQQMPLPPQPQQMTQAPPPPPPQPQQIEQPQMEIQPKIYQRRNRIFEDII